MNVLTEIKDKANIGKIMRFLTYKFERTEQQPEILNGFCYFCDDPDGPKTMSFNTKNKVWYCFKCHKGGDILAYVALKKKCSVIDAAKWICKVSGIRTPNKKLDALLVVDSAKEKDSNE